MNLKDLSIGKKWSLILETGVIVSIACFPLFFNLPFRDNIYLSWEGAYRMYQGQMPFVDFGLPMGYGFWLLPALSFKLFGPFLHSLIKIQVLVNVISGFSFRSIIKNFAKDEGLVLISVFLYVISFSFFNYWPWYNHSVIVFEFIGLALLLLTLTKNLPRTQKFLLLFASAFFIFLSIFTKQDGGAFALMISGVLLLYTCVIERKFDWLIVFSISYLTIALVFIGPLIAHEFGYWFNYGQEPHYSRVSLIDILSTLFGQSQFIKLYFFLILLIILHKSTNGLSWLLQKENGLHLLLTLGILFQASILQVTSYVPADGNIYFHSFMVFYILKNIPFHLDYSRLINLSVICLAIFLWWSGVYWKYTSRIFTNLLQPKNPEKNVVSINTYAMSEDTTVMDKSAWTISPEKPFSKIKLPQETISAIERLKKIRSQYPKDAKILNMSELTPLAEVLDYELETDMPLWYHLNVAMFDRELQKINGRIKDDYYDLVLFEVIPYLNNFYPFPVRDVLQTEYQLLFTFQAPREYTTEVIEVYVRKKQGSDASFSRLNQK